MKANTGNVTAIDNKPNERAILIAKARDDLPQQLEIQAIIAKMMWARFKELIKAGFTPEQAIELCKKII